METCNQSAIDKLDEQILLLKNSHVLVDNKSKAKEKTDEELLADLLPDDEKDTKVFAKGSYNKTTEVTRPFERNTKIVESIKNEDDDEELEEGNIIDDIIYLHSGEKENIKDYLLPIAIGLIIIILLILII